MPVDNSSLLQAFISSTAAKHANDELAFQKEQGQQLLKQHQQEIDDIAKTHQNDINIRKTILKQQLEQIHNEHMGDGSPAPDAPISSLPQPNSDPTAGYGSTGTIGLPATNAASATSPYTYHPTGSEGELFPEGIQVDPQYRQKQTDRATAAGLLNARLEGLKARYEAEGKSPAELEKIDRENQGKMDVAKLTRDSAEKIATGNNTTSQEVERMRAASSERDANITGGYSLAGHRLMAAAEIEAAKQRASGSGEDPDAVLAAYKENLNGGKIPTGKLGQAVYSLHSKLGTIPPPKEAAPALAAGQQINELIQQYTDAAKTYSRDAPGGGIAALGRKMLTKTGPLVETENNLRSQGGTVAGFFDQQKRKSDAEILRSVHGMFDPMLTTQENLNNIEKHKSSFYANVRGALHGLPQHQVDATLRDNNIEIPKSHKANDMVTLKTPSGTHKMPFSAAQKYVSADPRLEILDAQ